MGRGKREEGRVSFNGLREQTLGDLLTNFNITIFSDYITRNLDSVTENTVSLIAVTICTILMINLLDISKYTRSDRSYIMTPECRF